VVRSAVMTVEAATTGSIQTDAAKSHDVRLYNPVVICYRLIATPAVHLTRSV